MRTCGKKCEKIAFMLALLLLGIKTGTSSSRQQPYLLVTSDRVISRFVLRYAAFQFIKVILLKPASEKALSMETFWKRYDLLYEGPAKEALNCTERKFTLSYEPGDVVIVGNPKTGTTWLQQILHQIRTKGDENFTDIYLETRFIPYYFSEIPGYDPLVPQKARPRVFKSHDQYQWIPKDKNAKVTEDNFKKAKVNF